jgi:hypothetical protein
MNRRLGIGLTLLFALTTLAGAQSWTQLNNPPPFSAGTALLLTDGTVMVQQMDASNRGTGNWWRLTPDSFGSYQNGTWTQQASMPAGYAPLYYASAVLPDGRVVIMGGEYNGDEAQASDTTLGAIYNPANDTTTSTVNPWTQIPAPPGVGRIGDASSVVLPNGTFMLGPCCQTTTDWLLNPSTLTWTSTGAAGKADVNSEEGWTLLPNGTVLTVDTQNGTNSEIFDPSSGSWSTAGSTIVPLPNNGGQAIVPEIGPHVLRPDGTVFAFGGTSYTSIYNTINHTWIEGPTFSSNLDVADGPAALMPNGHIVVDTSPGVFGTGVQFFEVSNGNYFSVPNPPNIGGNNTSFFGRMLVLPTGEILFTNQTNQVALYTSSGSYQAAWQPTISSISSASLGIGLTNYSITGTQFNGLSQGAMYGDDAQSATNYPLIRVTNNATGHVFYMKTHDHSTMAVATGGASVSTMFDVPGNVELGDSTLQVVANGIPSNPYPVTVYAPRRRACCTF